MDNIIEKIDTVFKLQKELEELGIIDCIDLVRHGKSIQVAGGYVEDFINLANGKTIEIVDIDSDLYSHEATFKDGEYTFFVVLSEESKVELEKLINEREADKFISELGAL